MDRNILVVIPNTPLPRFGGGSLRMFHLVRFLARQFKVDLLGLAADSRGEAVQIFKQWCEEVELMSPETPGRQTSRWRVSPYERHPVLEEKIHKRLASKKYAAVHVEKPAMLPYLPSDTSVPIVLDVWSYGLSGPWRNVRSQTNLASRCRSLIQLTRFGLFDWFCWPDPSCIVVVSDEDRRRCERAHPNSQVVVVPNGVDCAALQPKSWSSSDPPIVMFSGDLGFSPNVDAALFLAQEIFPGVRRHHPDATLWLVGRNPADSVQKLQTSHIRVTGEVQDMGAYLHRASVYVAPHFTGAGTRTKILEAMGAGLPIVSTRIGMEGINAVNLQDVIMADSVIELQNAIVTLLHNGEERRRMGSAARKLAERHYDWQHCLQPLVTLYGTLLAKQVA